MQRRYNTDFYNNLILKLAERIPNVGIGVDVIVGTPGETEEYFLETYNFLKNLPVSYLHVFTYSERPDTKAIDMPGHVDLFDRKKRNNMLRILSEKKKNEFYRKNIGANTRVLFEAENAGGFIYGWSDNYIRVKQAFDESLINSFSDLVLTGIDANVCTIKLNDKKLKNAVG
jgi:threonylcarbamoyladenosine tRNA methylthiotransferase MtaB